MTELSPPQDSEPAPLEPVNSSIPVTTQPDPRHRWPDLTWVFVLLAGGLVSGLIVQWPGLAYCPNDGSRWSTVYMLTEHGTYRYKANHNAPFRKGQKFFESVNVSSMPADEIDRRVNDKRLIRVTDNGVPKYYTPTGSPPAPGDLIYLPPFETIDMIRLGDNYYSSKPPLLATMVAGVVWVIEKTTRINFGENPWFIIRTALIIVQAIPLMAFVWIVGRYVRGVSTSWFVQTFCLGVAALGTYLTPWSVTLNNHVAAAFSSMFAIYCATQIWYAGRREWYLFAGAGFFGALAAVMELPAASLAAAAMLALLIKAPRRTLAAALAPALIPVAGFLLTNYLAVGTIRPAYADFGKQGGPYDYPGSYWLHPQGMDALHEPPQVYLTNILVGHHGFFLLTPILLVGFIGMAAQLSFRAQTRPMLALLVFAITAVVVWFYTYSPFTHESKNYGGTTQGTRWLFWLIPLWLTMLPPGVELFSRSRFTRGMLYLLVCVSAVSVGFALRQPWGASWAHLLFRQFKWINY